MQKVMHNLKARSDDGSTDFLVMQEFVIETTLRKMHRLWFLLKCKIETNFNSG